MSRLSDMTQVTRDTADTRWDWWDCSFYFMTTILEGKNENQSSGLNSQLMIPLNFKPTIWQIFKVDMIYRGGVMCALQHFCHNFILNMSRARPGAKLICKIYQYIQYELEEVQHNLHIERSIIEIFHGYQW